MALARNGVAIDHREDSTGNSHARVITMFIDDLMKSNLLSLNELDAIAVSEGPGSYTGLRIGTSTAKGLCYALNKPLVTVPTLKALAAGIKNIAPDGKAYYLPMLDARRMDIYYALFDGALNASMPTSFATVDDEFVKRLSGYSKIYFGGSGAEKSRATLTNVNAACIENVACHARFMAAIAEEKYKNNEVANLAYFEPVYLKEFGK